MLLVSLALYGNRVFRSNFFIIILDQFNFHSDFNSLPDSYFGLLHLTSITVEFKYTI